MKIYPLLALLCLGNFGHGQDTSGLANGDNTPIPGDIVPDSITFAMVPTPAINALDIEGVDESPSFVLPELENRRYSDFPNEVVITVYHTPW